MRSIKLFGLTALAALGLAVGAALIDPGSASTQDEGDSEIVLCKHAALLLCAANEIWGSGKGVTGKPQHFEILGEVPVLCENGAIVGPIEPMMAPSLTWNVVSTEVYECKEGCTVAFQEFGNSEFQVETGDRYSLLVDVKIKADCPVDATCVYSGHATLEVDEPDTSGTPILLAVKEPLTVNEGKPLCGESAKWDAEIKLKGGSLTILFALFQLLT